MTEIDIRRLDVTLLLVMASLLRTRQATATARQLGVTQSSVSHSLAKLRDVFSDELFVRRPQGLEPTARALTLQPTINHILDLTREAVRMTPFDPKTASRLLRIAGTDYVLSLITGPLLEALEKQAPGIQVSLQPATRQSAIAALTAGDLDFALGLYAGQSEKLISTPLWEDDYWVLARKGHPVFKTSCTLSAYLDARHVLVSLEGGLVGLVDRALAEKAAARNVVAAAPYFMTALTAVAQSNVIATMPGSIGRAYAKKLDVRMFPCPVAVRRLKISLLSVAGRANDPVHHWMADLIQSTAREKILGAKSPASRKKVSVKSRTQRKKA